MATGGLEQETTRGPGTRGCGWRGTGDRDWRRDSLCPKLINNVVSSLLVRWLGDWDGIWRCWLQVCDG